MSALDIVPPTSGLSPYRLVVAPHLHILDDDTARRLDAYVRAGGHLVLGPRSGMKNRDSALLPSRQPGPLSALLGAHVAEYYALEWSVPLEPAGEARIWAEWLVPDTAATEVVLRYGACNGWLDGQPAAVTHRHGSGRITYVGAWLDDATMKRLAKQWIAESGMASVAVPEGIELCRRVGPRGDVFICINHTRDPKTVSSRFPFVIFSGQTCDGQVTLAQYGVAVLVAV